MPNVLKIIVYPLAAVFFLVFFSLVLFPFDSLKERFIQEAERALATMDPSTDYEIQIKELSFLPLSTFSLKDFSIGTKASAGSEGTLAKFSKVKLKINPFGLIWGDVDIDFDLKDQKSRVTGSVEMGKELTRVSSTIEKLDLGLLKVLVSRWKISVEGRVSGDVVLELYKDNPLKNLGSVHLQIDSLKMGEMHINDAVTLPPLSIVAAGSGPSKIDLDINHATWNVDAIQLHGEDVEMDVNGKVYGARRMDSYRLNLKGAMKLAPSLSGKVSFLSLIESYKDANGVYPLTVTGRFTSPNIRIGEFKIPLF